MIVLHLGNEDARGQLPLEGGGSVLYQQVSPGLIVDGFELIIIPSGLRVTQAHPESPVGKAEIKAFLARLSSVLNKGTHLCFILDTHEVESDVLLKSMTQNRVRVIQSDSQKIISEIPEMQNLFDVYGRQDIGFDVSSGVEDIKPIAKAESMNWRVHGICDISHKGNIYFLPVFPVHGDEKRFLETLVPAISTHLKRQRQGGAPIVAEFTFSNEKELRRKHKELQQELITVETEINNYNERKSILFFTDDELANEIPTWFENNLNLKVRRTEEYVEDFWLRDSDSKEDIAIGEVKALTKNVKRQHIAALVLHREERDREENFPSILIVNTFAHADTVDEKDKVGVSPKEIAFAVKNNVLIIRTIDLVRLADLVEQKKLTATKILEILTTESGWLRVQKNLEFNCMKN